MPRLALFGADPDTMNMGVSALFASTLAGIRRTLPSSEFVVFDSGLGRREASFPVSEDQTVACTMFGGRAGHRYYRSENLLTILAAASAGPLGPRLNEGVKLIDGCDAVLDASGGDSFSDIYGSKRFLSVVRPKLIALKRNIPLILLPQTYGPYKDPARRLVASRVVRAAALAWARDLHSYEVLKDLLGESFDPQKHRCGVDLAFSLSPRPAPEALDGRLRSWLAREVERQPIVGFNVNGLIFNDPVGAQSSYSFKADYGRIVTAFLTWLLENTDSLVVLTPHVMRPQGHYESDYSAALAVAKQLPQQFSKRIAISPRELDQCQVKWVISQMDWFCGTRMHSTIAALSSTVPAASVAYSDKTKGVFESCGLGEYVWDPRVQSSGDIVAGLIQSFEARAEAKTILRAKLPMVERQAAEQIMVIATAIQEIAAVKDIPV